MPLPDSDRAVFTDMYRFYEKFAARPLDVTAFMDAADECTLLVHKHGNTLLAKDMFRAIYDHLSNKYMEGKDHQ